MAQVNLTSEDSGSQPMDPKVNPIQRPVSPINVPNSPHLQSTPYSLGESEGVVDLDLAMQSELERHNFYLFSTLQQEVFNNYMAEASQARASENEGQYFSADCLQVNSRGEKSRASWGI